MDTNAIERTGHRRVDGSEDFRPKAQPSCGETQSPVVLIWSTLHGAGSPISS